MLSHDCLILYTIKEFMIDSLNWKPQVSSVAIAVDAKMEPKHMFQFSYQCNGYICMLGICHP